MGGDTTYNLKPTKFSRLAWEPGNPWAYEGTRTVTWQYEAALVSRDNTYKSRIPEPDGSSGMRQLQEVVGPGTAQLGPLAPSDPSVRIERGMTYGGEPTHAGYRAFRVDVQTLSGSYMYHEDVDPVTPGALVAVVGSSLSYFRYFFLIAVAAKMGTTYKLRPWVRMPFSAARRALTRRREREEPPV